MHFNFKLLTNDQIQQVHDASLQVLNKTGMRFESEALLTGLKKIGGKVDSSSGTAFFSPGIVEQALEGNRKLLKEGARQHPLNGVTSEKTDIPGIQAKMGGGCENYLDWRTQSICPASEEELVRSIQIGEKIPEITFIGNPIVIKKDRNGNTIEERLRRVYTASLLSRYTRKPGSIEVWDEKEIDLLVELGTIVRGGRKEYFDNPCFVTAKETISPLFLDGHSGDILLALACRKLPCTIIPMPLNGLSSPITKLGNVIVGNAEILGVITAIRSVYPEAVVGGGTISGTMNMKTAAVSFSAPEAILQDIAIGEVHEELYGLNYLIGTGYTDAKYPNRQVVAEKLMKFLLTYFSGRYTYPIGLINSGSVFSMEQALVDLELCRYLHSHFESPWSFSEIDSLIDLIGEAGIRGGFIDQEHTLDNYGKNWMSDLFDETSFVSFTDSREKDLYNEAHKNIERLESGGDFYRIEKEKEKEIRSVLKRAESIL